MGYLSQKKQQKRITLFLNAAVLAAFLFVCGAFSGSFEELHRHVVRYFFQYYVLFLLLLAYALFARRFWHASLLLLLIILDFFWISPYANLFFGIDGRGSDTLKVVYQNNVADISRSLDAARRENAEIAALNAPKSQPYIYDENYKLLQTEDSVDKSFIFSILDSEKGGRVRFTPNRVASYLTINKGGKEVLLLNVNFVGLRPSEEEVVYNNLTEFVLAQNIPVIIIGDFGMPGWSDRFRKFLDETGLEVKNRIIMSDGRRLFDPLAVPCLNVLGYKAMGVRRIEFLERQKNGWYPVLFKLSL